jgi:hypothetical protein
MRVPVAKGQATLAQIWAFGSGAIFLLVVIQTALGKYPDHNADAWGWLLPQLLPSLSTIFGAVTYNANQPPSSDTVDRLAFRLCIGLSVFFLLLVVAVLVLQPFADQSPIELMRVSRFWLAPVQGFVGLSLGVFFVSRKPAHSSAPPTADKTEVAAE